ncbi:hypothetical protein BKA67DRAFT_689606 [Truncatella angustata]|uniref:Uncharacterized protein n=1 Tax=Truncatella angustata TaxID=152316 RepID=A0A9P9A2R0_9PEZI|nr:uncharacterized protein BKA67DRAFT_689606 [Truncatella angustata]KAH6658476.1 hypothetical protein BKA67DRAFT_689606 [Truncatella angustata]KAH8195383.1 hypothetical protein TruAng_010440 [Truncatella angustata]
MNQFETYIDNLANTAKVYSDQCRTGSAETSRTRRDLLTIVFHLQTLLFQPTDFLQHLALQAQVLACLQWLGHFQILACVPLHGSVRVQDIADLTGVSELQLHRVLRMMAMVGFLREPNSGEMAHTELSASFVSRPSHLDAAMFLAEIACPAALHMASTTERHGQSDDPRESAYAVASNTSQSFQLHCQQRPKLQLQWAAFLRDVTNVVDDGASIEPLDSLDWGSLGDACIVDVTSQSVAHVLALADLYPALHFVVQTPDPDAVAYTVDKSQHSKRIMVHERGDGEPQIIKDAAVYLLRFTSPTQTMSIPRLRAHISRELRAHFGILSANPSASLILEITLLPEPGSASPSVERSARVLDMSLLHLTNEHCMELADIVELIENVRGGNGRLIVDKKIFSRSKAVGALEILYQVKPNR